jgi:hypothetical protein
MFILFTQTYMKRGGMNYVLYMIVKNNFCNVLISYTGENTIT